MTTIRSKRPYLHSASIIAFGFVGITAATAQSVPTQPTAADANAVQPTSTAPAPAVTGTEDAKGGLDEIVVTGSTSKRTLLNASVSVTTVNEQQLQLRAPRNTADVLDLIPGIFVEATAGPVSNNYSVRGLPGGGQAFISLLEDGMPVLYGGGGADEYFQTDITIDRVEAVEGGTSGILNPNAAGASINFISRKLNYDGLTSIGRFTAATYGEYRGDAYVSGPLAFLGKDVAFSVGGFFDSTKGVRHSPFTYQSYHVKAQLEKRFDDGGFVRATYRRWNEHDPYYADQPYSFNNGKIGGVPGLGTQFGNITGPGFASIQVPDQCASNECFRTFSSASGIHGKGDVYRLDIEKPLNDQVSVFLHSRYLQSDWDFNGIFPGSGSGNSGLTSAAAYLTISDASPIRSTLDAGLLLYPGTSSFGIRSLTTGQVIAGSNTAALNALNGNGLLQQTVLNHQFLRTRDFGNDFGVKFNMAGDSYTNSLTVGGMYYRVRQYNDQSGTTTLLNDVKDGSNIYDVVGLNTAGGVTGTLTNNGLLNYGDWGNGIWSNTLDSTSIYFNDEFTFNEKLHIDFGLRYEHLINNIKNGNSFATPQPIPAGIQGVSQTNPNTFDGTFTSTRATEHPLSYTVGANYTLTSALSGYARYAVGYQTNGGNNGNPTPTKITLYEAGARYGGHGFLGVITLFRTEFRNQQYDFIDTVNPAIRGSFKADSITNGIDIDATYRPQYTPLEAFSINLKATFQDPKFSNVFIGQTVNGVTVNSAQATQYNGKVPGRTPQTLLAVQPTFDLPNGLGIVYLRYKYVGKVFADAGNGLALPAYGTLALGGNVDISRNINLNVSVENVTNTLGLTEGNPRQGQTQSVTNGFFYGRGIVGTNALASLTLKF